jgi:hypothetical protein
LGQEEPTNGCKFRVFIDCGSGTDYALVFMEASTMPVKKSSDAKKSKNVGKRFAKLAVPKGEKVTSMKGSDFTITRPIDVSSPTFHK